MRRAISYVNSGKFRVETEAEQQLWNECSRLIANAIIYYNTLLLSRVYEQKLAAADLEATKILKGISPVAWRNINLIGNFDFSTSSPPVDIGALVARYQNDDFWRRSMSEEMRTAHNSQLDLFEGLGKNSRLRPYAPYSKPQMSLWPKSQPVSASPDQPCTVRYSNLRRDAGDR